MFSFYLQDRAYYYANAEEVLAHIDYLNSILIDADEYDHFLKNKDFLDCPYDRRCTILDFLEGPGISAYVLNRVLPMMMRRVKDAAQPFMGLAEMDAACKKTVNAFLGPKFSTNCVRLLTTYQQYRDFRSFHASHNVTSKNFVQCCRIALKHTVLLEDAIEGVLPLGKEVGQVFDDLYALDKYVQDYWKQGAFNLNDVRAKVNIQISDESETVKNRPKYKRTRYFNIPGVGGRYCYLHIKCGNGKRIYIYPDENTRIVYVTDTGLHKASKKNS